MRVLLLTDPSSIHSKRWVKSLCQRGFEVGVFGHIPSSEEADYYSTIPNCECFWVRKDGKGFLSKLTYLKVVVYLKLIIKEWTPDIVHAHWATRYGLIGALSGFHPLITSVWGSDVLILPRKSLLYRLIIKYVFKKSDYIFSTSQSMADETAKYTRKDVKITPFGVDTNVFKVDKDSIRNPIKIGIVKSLDNVYGIDILIRAFKELVERNSLKTIKLIIIGDGPQKFFYKELVKELNLSSLVSFVGKIDNTELPKFYNSFTVSVFPSRSESFGVVALESMACECPVITSDADGFKEIVEDGVSGIITKRGDISGIVSAIQQFIDNPDIRNKMGREGRERVMKYYSWENNVSTMISLYNIIKK